MLGIFAGKTKKVLTIERSTRRGGGLGRRSEMKIAADTNILVRVVVRDDERQTRLALKLLKEAELVAITLSCLCELVWVLDRGYGLGKRDIAAALEALFHARNVIVNRPAVDAGLAVLNEGGDFADGVIAYEGRWLGRILLSLTRRQSRQLPGRGSEPLRPSGSGGWPWPCSTSRRKGLGRDSVGRGDAMKTKIMCERELMATCTA